MKTKETKIPFQTHDLIPTKNWTIQHEGEGVAVLPTRKLCPLPTFFDQLFVFVNLANAAVYESTGGSGTFILPLKKLHPEIETRFDIVGRAGLDCKESMLNITLAMISYPGNTILSLTFVREGEALRTHWQLRTAHLTYCNDKQPFVDEAKQFLEMAAQYKDVATETTHLTKE